MTNLKFGFLLMIVGMASVFAILLLLIFFGNLLIAMAKRMEREEEEVRPAAAQPEEDEEKMRPVLDAAVAQITGGKGRITKITRI